MSNRAVCFLLAGLTVLMDGCAMQGPRFSEISPSPGEGLVHIYRLEGPVGRLIGAGFFVDDQSRVFHVRNVVLHQHEYTSFRLSPGPHTIRQQGAFPAEPSSITLAIDVVADEIEYVRLTSDSVGWKLEKVVPAVGRREIAACRYRAPAQLPAETPQ
jgi:hypothetical protein